MPTPASSDSTPVKHLIHLLLLTMLATPALLTAGDAVDKEALRYNDAVTRLQRTRDEGIAKEKARSITALSAIAKAKAKANDLAAAGTAWKAVLALDDANAEARKHFEALGQLDAVLADLKAGDSAADLLGQPAAPTVVGGAPASAAAIAGKPVTIPAAVDKAVQLGPFKAGTELTFQFVSGTWTFRDGSQQSPDAKVTGPRYRLRVATDPTPGRDGGLAVLPSGTAQSPYTLRLDTDVPRLYLMMNSELGIDTREGSVIYRIEINAR